MTDVLCHVTNDLCHVCCDSPDGRVIAEEASVEYGHRSLALFRETSEHEEYQKDHTVHGFVQHVR